MPLGGVPKTIQTYGHSCGAATVTTILRLFGQLAFENPTAKELETGDGTNHLTMVYYLESKGLNVEEMTDVSDDTLRQIIQAKKSQCFFPRMGRQPY